MRRGVQRKKVSTIIFILLACCLMVLIFPSILKANAESVNETLEQKIVRFTDSDYLDGDSTTTIKQFAANYKAQNYRPAGYEYYNDYPVTNIMSKVVPIELFYTEGVHLYMGKEYGFIIYTYTNNNHVSYFSQILLIDFTFDTKADKYGNSVSNQPTYKMETLFQAFLEVRKNNGDWEIIQPHSWLGTDIYLKNVFIGANLENENEYNAYDVNYVKNNDDGDLILYAGVDYCAHQFVGTTSFKELGTWSIKQIVTKGLDFVGDLGIPVASPIANVTGKAIEFATDTNVFVNLAGSVYTVEDKIHTTITPQSRVEQTYATKETQKRSDKYVSYSREVYVAQDEMGGAAVAEFVPGVNSNDDNSFVELQVITAGGSNSRVNFTVGFEAVFQQVTSSNVVLKADGSFDIVPQEFPESTPVVITHAVEHKIYDKTAEFIKDVSIIGDSNDDNIANDPAYLLDKNGYMLYKFQPKFNNEFAFGNYTFSTNQYTTMQPSTRIYLLKSTNNGQPLDEEKIIKMSRDELLNSSYLLAYNNTGYSDMWKLTYEFTNMGNEAQNTYYVLYKYSFDYLYGSSAFLARSEFTPDVLNVSQSTTRTLNANGKVYYVFTPNDTFNYIINVSGPTSAALTIYDEHHNQISMETGNNFHALMKANNKYYIEIKNLGNNSTANISVIYGETVGLSNYEYTASYSINVNQTHYYKFVPQNLTGTYKVESAGIEQLQVTWYNRYFEVIQANSQSAFLSKNEVYYIGLNNKAVTSNAVGNFVVSYQNDIAFNSRIGIYTEGYKQYLAYVIEGSNVDGVSKTVTLAIDDTTVCNNKTFNGGEFVYDLSNYYFTNTTTRFTCEVIVNGNQKIYLDPIVITDYVSTYSKGMTISAPYSHIKFTSTVDYTDACLVVPSSVKVLSIEASWSYYIRGIYIDVAYSNEPLVINIRNIDLFAPYNFPTLNSNRDIIFNVSGTVRLTGGAGVNDEFYTALYGDPAIEMTDNTLVLNGTGTLTLIGGKGGNTSSGRSFYYNSTAGKGGTAVEVGNLVINISTLKVTGGAGGNGGAGTNGADGQDGVGYQSNGVGARGTDGENGGYGCGGGNGGMGIWIVKSYCAIYTTNITVSGGQGGNGGRGGNGGKGGNGARGKDGGLFGGQCGGGRGGSGGQGGNGGDYGTGMIAFNEYDINKVINFTSKDFTSMFQTWSSNGTPGAGGSGGKGGTGGPGGKNTWGSQAPSGPDGYDGLDGNPGGNPNPYYSMANYNLDSIHENILNEYLVERMGIEKIETMYGIQVKLDSYKVSDKYLYFDQPTNGE